MRWVNIYEEHKRVIYDTIRVKHTYRRVGQMRFYICQFSLVSEINSIGQDFAQKFYLVKTYHSHMKRPSRFNIKNGDIVRCFYYRTDKRETFKLDRIITKGEKEMIYPHPCYRDVPIETPLYSLYEL